MDRLTMHLMFVVDNLENISEDRLDSLEEGGVQQSIMSMFVMPKEPR